MCLLLLPVEHARASEANPLGFQDTRWGMTPIQVQKLYPKSGMKDGVLYGSKEVASRAAVIAFKFSNGKLSSVDVVFLKQYENAGEMLEDFAQIVQLLLRKYGPPGKTNANWERDRYVGAGWRWTETTLVALGTESPGFPQIRLQYASGESVADWEEREAVQHMKDL